MQEGVNIESEGSPVLGSTSTCEPGTHKWISMVVTHGEIFGQDSRGFPVFVPSPVCPAEAAFGCAICDEPWTSALSEPAN
jgi:hypothetical protein